MARKRKNPDNRKGSQINIYVDPELKKALEELAIREDRSITAEVERSLRKHLAEHGLWPPTPPKE